MDYATSNLRNYYDKKYSHPKTDSEAILTIIKVYQTEMSDYSEKIGEGIGEIYRELLGKGLPSYYWFLEAIHRTAKKREEKRTFGYIVGTLRNWALYGFGNTATDEEEEVYDFFKEVTGVELTMSSRKMISSLMGNYGALKLMRSISGLKDIDVSTIFAEILGRMMSERYENPFELQMKTSYQLPPTNSKVEIVQTTPVSQNEERRYKREISDNLKLMISYVEDYLRENGVSRPTDIQKFLNAQGFIKVTQKNVSSHLVAVMKHSKKVVKIGVGKYSYTDA